MSRPLLLAHRGARATRTIPENTIPSFDLALAHGCDGFEFDVRRTADGRAVVCHDACLAGVDLARASAEELPELPLLEQILCRYRHSFLDIELKVPGLEERLLKLLEASPPARGYVVSSFLPSALTQVWKLSTHVPLGLICENRAQLTAWQSLPVSCVIPHYRLVDENLVRTLHAAAKKVLVWMVNETEQMRRLASWQVDALISDDTELLVKVGRGLVA